MISLSNYKEMCKAIIWIYSPYIIQKGGPKFNFEFFRPINCMQIYRFILHNPKFVKKKWISCKSFGHCTVVSVINDGANMTWATLYEPLGWGVSIHDRNLHVLHDRPHGTYIRWKLRNSYASKDQSLSFDLLKEFD